MRSITSPVLRQLDTKLRRLARYAPELRPRGGWVRTIRKNLRMTLAQLAQRMGVTFPTVAGIEKREVLGTVSLGTLRHVADAMDCDLVYFLLPRRSLEGTIQAQARKVAERMVGAVSHSMALEDQAISAKEQEQQIRDLAAELVRAAGARIWDETPPR
jgi:predicted DNA-binding mobile mystery protein A